MPLRTGATSPPILGDVDRAGGWLKSSFEVAAAAGTPTALQMENTTNLQLEDGVTDLEYAVAA